MVSPEEIAVVVLDDEELSSQRKDSPSQRVLRVSAKDLVAENVDLRAAVTSSHDLIESLEAELRSLVVDAANVKASQCSCQRGQKRLVDGAGTYGAIGAKEEVLRLQAEVEALKAKAEWEAVQRKAAEARLIRVASNERGRPADICGDGADGKQMPDSSPDHPLLVASSLSPAGFPENSDEESPSVDTVATEVLVGEEGQEQQHVEGQHQGDSAAEEGDEDEEGSNAQKNDADAVADCEMAANGEHREDKVAQGSEVPAFVTSEKGAIIIPLEEELVKAREAAQRAEAWAAVLQAKADEEACRAAAEAAGRRRAGRRVGAELHSAQGEIRWLRRRCSTLAAALQGAEEAQGRLAASVSNCGSSADGGGAGALEEAAALLRLRAESLEEQRREEAAAFGRELSEESRGLLAKFEAEVAAAVDSELRGLRRELADAREAAERSLSGISSGLEEARQAAREVRRLRGDGAALAAGITGSDPSSLEAAVEELRGQLSVLRSQQEASERLRDSALGQMSEALAVLEDRDAVIQSAEGALDAIKDEIGDGPALREWWKHRELVEAVETRARARAEAAEGSGKRLGAEQRAAIAAILSHQHCGGGTTTSTAAKGPGEARAERADGGDGGDDEEDTADENEGLPRKDLIKDDSPPSAETSECHQSESQAASAGHQRKANSAIAEKGPEQQRSLGSASQGGIGMIEQVENDDAEVLPDPEDPVETANGDGREEPVSDKATKDDLVHVGRCPVAVAALEEELSRERAARAEAEALLDATAAERDETARGFEAVLGSLERKERECEVLQVVLEEARQAEEEAVAEIEAERAVSSMLRRSRPQAAAHNDDHEAPPPAAAADGDDKEPHCSTEDEPKVAVEGGPRGDKQRPGGAGSAAPTAAEAAEERLRDAEEGWAEALRLLRVEASRREEAEKRAREERDARRELEKQALAAIHLGKAAKGGTPQAGDHSLPPPPPSSSSSPGTIAVILADDSLPDDEQQQTTPPSSSSSSPLRETNKKTPQQMTPGGRRPEGPHTPAQPSMAAADGCRAEEHRHGDEDDGDE